jgi:hypothetical protein
MNGTCVGHCILVPDDGPQGLKQVAFIDDTIKSLL